ncbi:MAG: DUF2219 family protein [Bacteroidales bacterium]|nr:DUF2219 family protein [Bacteroidales bacterium]
MKRFLIVPVIAFLVLCSSSFVHAQLTDPDIQKEIEHINALSTTSFLTEIQSNNISREQWLSNELLRHAVVKKLDITFDELYNWWIDAKSFEEFWRPDSIQMNKSKNESFKNFLGDSVYKEITQDYSRKKWRNNKSALFFQSWDLLFTFLQLDKNIYDQSVMQTNISSIRNHTTLQYLSYIYYYQINNPVYSRVNDFIKTRNFNLINQRLAIIEQTYFVHYKSNDAHLKPVKEIDFFMDNDFFIPGGFNQDRDYTGGGAITVSTDYFSSRWLNPGWIFYSEKGDEPHRIVMNYQTLSVGMHFYTPYIRYRNNYDLADTLHGYDRPFGSYVYFNRSKYRLWPKGLVRYQGSFQVGIIGSNTGRDIQAVLHRDATVKAQRVYGWDTQIANGGRWLLQLNHNIDLLLFSTSNKYKSIFTPNIKNTVAKNVGWNIIANGDFRYGGFLTSAGGGIKISSTDFTRQSGQETLKPFKNNAYKFAFSVDAGLSYRYVFHNSMLEGFGYRSTYTNDEYDNESESVYSLNQSYYEFQNDYLTGDEVRYPNTPPDYDQLNRHLYLIDFGINFRWRKMTIYYQMTLNRKEFEIEEINYEGLMDIVSDDDKKFFKEEVITELHDYNSKKMYGYGRVGISWLL